MKLWVVKSSSQKAFLKFPKLAQFLWLIYSASLLCAERKISRIHAELCYAIKEKVSPWDRQNIFLHGFKGQLHFYSQ